MISCGKGECNGGRCSLGVEDGTEEEKEVNEEGDEGDGHVGDVDGVEELIADTVWGNEVDGL